MSAKQIIEIYGIGWFDVWMWIMDVIDVIRYEPDVRMGVKGRTEATGVGKCVEVVVELDNWGLSFCSRFEGHEE